MPNLQVFDAELKQNNDHENRSNEARDIVLKHYIDFMGCDPGMDVVADHFLEKHYRYLEVTDPNQLASDHERESAFYEFIDSALMRKYKGDPTGAASYFDRALQFANHLNAPFLVDHHGFAQTLSGNNLLLKLKTDMCYENVNKRLQQSQTLGIETMGKALSLANTIGDIRRISDLLLKCQYVLYEIEPNQYIDAALCLGHYLLTQTQGVEYHTMHAWVQFHMGNIRLDLAQYQEAKADFENAQTYFDSIGFHYARMTLQERLGLTNKNLDDFAQANQHYQNSLTIAATESTIPPVLVTQNLVRVTAGQGLVLYKQQSYDDAEKKLRAALELAKQIGYSANIATILSSLGDVCRGRDGDTDTNARAFHKMAYHVKTKELGLDSSLERIEHDRLNMNN